MVGSSNLPWPAQILPSKFLMLFSMTVETKEDALVKLPLHQLPTHRVPGNVEILLGRVQMVEAHCGYAAVVATILALPTFVFDCTGFHFSAMVGNGSTVGVSFPSLVRTFVEDPCVVRPVG